MFKKFQNTSIANFLLIVLCTAFLSIFLIQPDRAVGATFNLYLGDGDRFEFTIVNNSSDNLSYDFSGPTGGAITTTGDVASGGTAEVSFGYSFLPSGNTIEQGSVTLIYIDGKPAPYFRFWSGDDGQVQYINALGENGYEVETDNSEISEIAGNGLRITVDGGGNDDPLTDDIYIQVYDD